MRIVVNATAEEIAMASAGPVVWDIAVYGSLVDSPCDEVSFSPLPRRFVDARVVRSRMRRRRPDAADVAADPRANGGAGPERPPARVPRWERLVRLVRETDLALVGAADAVYSHLRRPLVLPRRLPFVWSTNGVIPAIWNWRRPGEREHVRDRHVALQRDIGRRADLVVCWSDHGREHLIDLAGIDPDQVVMVPPPLRLAEPRGPGLKPIDGVVTALYVGAAGFLKGLPELLDAVAATRTVQLHVVGPQPPPNAPPRTVWHGRQPPDRVAALLATADLLAVPARYETLGVCYLEAMKAGKPVLATNLGTTREIVADTGVLVPPGDVAALTAALADLAADPSRRESLGAAARERYDANYAPDVCSARLAAVLRERL